MLQNFLILSLLFNKNNAYRAMAEYTVVRGDTLWKISREYNVALQDLIDANPQIQNPDMIYPGQIIYIPISPRTTPDTSQPEQPGQMAGSLEAQVVELINQERTSRGLSPLSNNTALADAARVKSEDMAQNNYFSHNSPTYGSPFDLLSQFGIRYSAAGENIAQGQTTAQSVVNAWMNSQGHRENILNGNFTQTGVGYTNANGTPLWTQMFIRP